MKTKGWQGLHYIDLFAGAGIERIEGGGLDWGSPLIAAQAPNRFTQLHFCEIKAKSHHTLDQRLKRFPQPNSPQVLLGDANKLVKEINDEIPNGSLSLAFLDPYGLDLQFNTLKSLSQKRIDLIIFSPIIWTRFATGKTFTRAILTQILISSWVPLGAKPCLCPRGSLGRTC